MCVGLRINGNGEWQEYTPVTLWLSRRLSPLRHCFMNRQDEIQLSTMAMCRFDIFGNRRVKWNSRSENTILKNASTEQM